jgi:zinc transport system ATP-binding protein
MRRRECKVREFFQAPSPRDVISLRGVWVRLGGETVLQDITFSVKEGSFLGIIGPNGAGKSTLLRVILGLVRPEKGEVKVLGMDPRRLREELHHVGYLPQNVLFDPLFPVSVYDVVMMGRICCIGPLRFPGRKDREAVLESIQAVGLKGLERRPIGELSGGQQKRTFLARALCLETRVLLLDEPTAGLDLEGQESLLSLIANLKDEKGLTVVLVSHDLGVLSRYADELVCIRKTMHLHGRPSEVLGSEGLKEVYRCEFDFLSGLGVGPGAGG